MKEEVNKRIADIVSEFGYLIKAEIKGSKELPLVKVIADTDSGITLDQITAISRKILNDDLLSNLIGENYRLEVTSPGLDFQMTEPRHFRKHIGRKLELHHTMENLKSPIKAELLQVTDTALTVIYRKEELQIPLKSLNFARIILNF